MLKVRLTGIAVWAAVLLSFFAQTAQSQSNARGMFEFVSRVGNPDDGATDLVLDGKTLFVANKFSGLQIIDISDIRRPIIRSRTKSEGQNFGIAKKDKMVFLSDNKAGLVIYDVTSLSKPKLVTSFETRGEAWDVQIKDNYAFVAAGLAGLLVIDITDPKAPKEVGSLRFDKDWDFARQLLIRENRLYLADRKAGVHIINIENPLAPKEIKRFPTQFAEGLDVWDNYICVADGPSGFVILDITNPEKIRQIAAQSLPGYANRIFKEGPYVYIGVDDAGIRAYDVSNPAKPFFDARYDTPGQTFGMIKYDIFLVAADLNAVLFLTHNKPPVITRSGDKVIAENQTLRFKIKGMDPDNNPIGFSANFIPQGASFDIKDTVFSWTPSFEQSGVYEGIVFSATEKTQSALFSRDTIKITVNNVNRAPALPSTGNYTVDENKELAFTINKPSDPDIEDTTNLKVELTNPPTGAIFDSKTLTFKWIPAYDQSGVYTLSFVVTDGGGATDTKQTTLTVKNINRPPMFDALAASFTTDENKPVSFTIVASDLDKEDAGKLEWGGFNIPPGATFDRSSGVLTWTPSYDQSGKYDGIYFIVRDAEGLSDTVNTSITVNHVNRPPFFATVDAQKIDEVKPLSFKIAAADADAEDDGKLTIKATTVPQGAIYNEITRTLTWTPTYDQSGDYTAVFKVTDPAGASDEMTVPVQVVNINRAPSIAAVPAQNADENKAYTLVVTEGTDPDKEDVGKLTYKAENLPQGATFDPATRTIAWTPTYDQSGVYEGVKVTVTDALGLTATTTFRFTVKNINRPPVMEVIAAQTSDEQKPLTFQVKFSDPDKEDANRLTVAAAGMPLGASFAGGNFTWTPTFDQAGNYTVKFTVTDFEKLSDTKEAVITINNVNRPPVLAAILAQAATENTPFTFTVPAANDPDKEDAGKLTYKAEGLPEGANFDAATRVVKWTPTFDQSGDHNIRITVTDVLGVADNKELVIKVKNVNRTPVVTDVAAQNGDENAKMEFRVETSDPDKEDADKLKVVAEQMPQGATFANNTFSWTPTFDQAGTYRVTFRATDVA
ncbi:MAG TPA: putative Ig domain-containing protein, partial [bacterium]|nr:putative Ig domain-containing protein [bacterium]